MGGRVGCIDVGRTVAYRLHNSRLLDRDDPHALQAPGRRHGRAFDRIAKGVESPRGQSRVGPERRERYWQRRREGEMSRDLLHGHIEGCRVARDRGADRGGAIGHGCDPAFGRNADDQCVRAGPGEGHVRDLRTMYVERLGWHRDRVTQRTEGLRAVRELDALRRDQERLGDRRGRPREHGVQELDRKGGGTQPAGHERVGAGVGHHHGQDGRVGGLEDQVGRRIWGPIDCDGDGRCRSHAVDQRRIPTIGQHNVPRPGSGRGLASDQNRDGGEAPDHRGQPRFRPARSVRRASGGVGGLGAESSPGCQPWTCSAPAAR